MRKTIDRFSSIDDISSSDMILDKTDHVDGFCYKKIGPEGNYSLSQFMCCDAEELWQAVRKGINSKVEISSFQTFELHKIVPVWSMLLAGRS